MLTEKELTVGVVQFCCIERVKLCKDFSFVVSLGRNILFYAARRTLEIFCFLLSKGLDLTKTICLGETCLTEACKSNNLSIVNYILNQPDSLNMDLHLPLKWACIVENYSMVSMLLEKGANPSKAMDIGDSLLDLCVTKSKLSIVRKLLQHGANPNSLVIGNHTPYTTSISHNRLDLVILLRIYGANHFTPLGNNVYLTLSRNPDYTSLYSFYTMSFTWSNLEVALASRSLEDVKFLIKNKKVDLKSYQYSEILEFSKKENLYLDQPPFQPSIYDYIKSCYTGWTKKNHYYYSEDFKQNIKLILSRNHKMQTSLPHELWLMIFSFTKLE